MRKHGKARSTGDARHPERERSEPSTHVALASRVRRAGLAARLACFASGRGGCAIDSRGVSADGLLPSHRPRRHARRRDPGLDAVHVRRARRMPHREIGSRQSRARRHAGAGRDGRLCGVLSHGIAMGGRDRGGARGLCARRDARRHLQSAQGQRCRGRHRHDAVRRRRRVLLRQALYPAAGAAARLDPVRRLERQPEPQKRAQHQSAVLRRHRLGAGARLGAAQHADGAGCENGRRQRGGGAGDGRLRQRRPVDDDDSRRLLRRRRRRVPVARPIPARGTRGSLPARA